MVPPHNEMLTLQKGPKRSPQLLNLNNKDTVLSFILFLCIFEIFHDKKCFLRSHLLQWLLIPPGSLTLLRIWWKLRALSIEKFRLKKEKKKIGRPIYENLAYGFKGFIEPLKVIHGSHKNWSIFNLQMRELSSREVRWLPTVMEGVQSWYLPLPQHSSISFFK